MLREVAVKVHQLAPGWGEARRASYVKHAARPLSQPRMPLRAVLACLGAWTAVRLCQAKCGAPRVARLPLPADANLERSGAIAQHPHDG